MVSGSVTRDSRLSGLPLVERSDHVLIAGCGYLGRRAAERWQRSGVRVSVITRSASKAGELANAGFEPIIGELAAGDFPALPDVDTVLWAVGFDRTSGQSREAIWIDGLQRLLQQLPSTAKRFLYVSSTGVYGQTTGEFVSESIDPQPTSDSGKCCLKAEQLLQAEFDGQPACSLTVLRMAGLYGPGRLLRRVSDLKASTPLPGNPGSYLNLIHIDDAVTAVIDVVARHDVELLNVVNTGTLTRSEYYSELARLVDAPLPVFDESAPIVRGGNKRVLSVVRESLPMTFRFDDVRVGLRDAVARGRH